MYECTYFGRHVGMYYALHFGARVYIYIRYT